VSIGCRGRNRFYHIQPIPIGPCATTPVAAGPFFVLVGQISNLPTGGDCYLFRALVVDEANRPPPKWVAVPNAWAVRWVPSLDNRKEDDTLISSYAYGHDNVGNRTSMTEANGDVTSYTYDNVYRLTRETKRDSGDNVLYRYQYTYDGVGNRLTENNAGEITYTYDSNNKLTQLVGPSGTTTFGYDNNGNMTSMVQPGPVTTTYGYNYENRLASVTNPSYTAAYTYSADGLRLRIQESNAQYTDRWFQYDGVRPVLEGTLSGDTYTTTAKYVWEGDSYYSPLVYSMLGGTWRYHMYDGLGSTRQLMLHASPYTITDTYSYEAFGNSMGSTGSTPNPYRYVGSLGYYQTGNDLMHLGARYYMPEVGRFLASDPINIGSLSYCYAGDDPVSSVDPSGLIANCYNPITWFASEECTGYHMFHRQAWQEAWDSGYYSCYARCMGLPVGIKGAELLYTHGGGPVWTARIYYHFTDRRFTAWGKSSKVLVPKLAGKIAAGAQWVSGAGTAYLAAESLNCMRKCSQCLYN